MQISPRSPAAAASSRGSLRTGRRSANEDRKNNQKFTLHKIKQYSLTKKENILEKYEKSHLVQVLLLDLVPRGALLARDAAAVVLQNFLYLPLIFPTNRSLLES